MIIHSTKSGRNTLKLCIILALILPILPVFAIFDVNFSTYPKYEPKLDTADFYNHKFSDTEFSSYIKAIAEGLQIGEDYFKGEECLGQIYSYLDEFYLYNMNVTLSKTSDPGWP